MKYFYTIPCMNPECRRVFTLQRWEKTLVKCPSCKAALSAAYPFGPREGHPYKMWLVEVKQALSLRSWALNTKAVADAYNARAQ